MKSVSKLLPLLIIVGLLLLIYELLLTQPSVVVTIHGSQSSHQSTLSQMTSRTRAFRQLLQDADITRLPVTIRLECSNYPNNPEENRNDNPDIVCLNETQIYTDSYKQFGVNFDNLSTLEKKAAIVRAVLHNLERQNHHKVPKFFNGLNLSLTDTIEAGAEDYDMEGDEEHITEPSKHKDSEVYFPRLKALPKPVLTPTAEAKAVKPKMNDDLLRLAGKTVEQSYDLSPRKFSTEWRVNSTTVQHRLGVVSMAVKRAEPSRVSLTENSLNPNLLERAKFQHEAVGSFCSGQAPTLPDDPSRLNTLFQHLLYDDTRKMVFCYVPKNGCSNMKRMMLVLNGILPPQASKERRPSESVLKQVHSFRDLSRDEAVHKLTHYFKLAIVRNPLERLLSAYMNKLERPFIADLRKQFPERLKAFMLKKFRRHEFEDWIAKNDSSVDIHPSFDDFIAFMNMFPLDVYNEHFKPFLQLCSPCAVNYDLFLSFKALEYDMFAMMEYFNIPFSLYPKSLAQHSQPVSELVQSYYQQVSSKNKEMLFTRFAKELDFYYGLHPEEWGMNNKL